MALTKENLEGIDNLIQTLRRRRNQQLIDAVNGKIYIYNLEDLMRLVGELNASHNHIVSALASDEPNLYCLFKHLPTAYTLSGEVDGDCKEIMDIIEALTEGKIKACQACSDDADELKPKAESDVEHKLV